MPWLRNSASRTAIMPTYELRSEDCGTTFELFVMRLLREDDKVCSACGSRIVSCGFGGGVLGKGTATATVSAATSCSSGGFT